MRQARHELLVPDVESLVISEATERRDAPCTLLYNDVQAEFQSTIVFEAVQQLKSKEKAVIILKYWGGYSDKAIALFLHVTDRTVRNLKRRAYKRLKQQLTEEENRNGAYL